MSMNQNGLQFNEDDNVSFYFSDFCRGFKKFWWIIAIVCAVWSVISVVNCRRNYIPMYKSEVTFTVSTQERATTSLSGIAAYNFYYDASTASHLSSTFPYILSSKLLQDEIVADLKLSSLPVSLTASSVTGSNMFTLRAEGYEPQLTYDALISAMENYPDIAKYVVGNIKFKVITSPILPTEPHNKPDYFNEIFKSVSYGLIFGVILLLCYTVLRTTVRTKKDISKNLNIKCLGVTPLVVFNKTAKEKSQPLLVNSNLTDDRFSDSIRTLRSLIRKQMKGDKKVVAVTSTIAGEGKTTICVNAAISFAAIGKKSLIVECDLNKPEVLKTLGVNENDLNYSIVTENYKIAYVEKHKVYVMLFVGEAASNEFLNSENLSKIFSIVKANYDYVFVDTPPCAASSDVMFISQATDGVLYVILQDTVRISKIKSELDALLATDAEILGCILNGAQASVMGYGYYKAYNKYGNYKGYGRYGKYGKYGRYGKYGKYGYGEKYGYGFQFEDSIDE